MNIKKLLILSLVYLTATVQAVTVNPKTAGERFVLLYTVNLESTVLSLTDGSSSTVETFKSQNFPEINLVRVIVDGDYLISGGFDEHHDWYDDGGGEYGDILGDKNTSSQGWNAIIGSEYDTEWELKFELGWANLDADWDDPSGDFHLVAWSDVYQFGVTSRHIYETQDLGPSYPYPWYPTIFYTDEVIAVPEPSISVLALLGICTMFFVKRS